VSVALSGKPAAPAHRLHDLISALTSNSDDLLSSAPIAWERETALHVRCLAEIDRFYGDLNRGFCETHVPRVGFVRQSVGFSSLAKFALAIVDGDATIGKCVVTLKRGGRLKVGPVFVEPPARGQGYTTHALRALIQGADRAGLTQIYATAPISHAPAASACVKAGFTLEGVLRNHYKRGSDEGVFTVSLHQDESLRLAPPYSPSLPTIAEFVARHYFSVDGAWLSWLDTVGGDLENFLHKPHDVAIDGDATGLVIYKRGGTAKVVLAGTDDDCLTRVLVQCEALCRKRKQRKLTLFWPTALPVASRLAAAYSRELAIPAGTAGSQIGLWSLAVGPGPTQLAAPSP